MRLFALSLSLLCLGPGLSQAGSPGRAAADFLKSGQGARAYAMGESQVAISDDARAAYWNPAGLAGMEHSQAAASYTQSFAGVDRQYFSLAYPIRLGSVLDLNFTRSAMSSFDGYDAVGVRTRRVDAGSYAAGLAFGHSLVKDDFGRPVWSLGMNVKGIHDRLDTAQARTWAADVGAMGHLRLGRLSRDGGKKGQELRFGLAARNLGPGLRFDRVSSELPLSLHAGMGWVIHPKGDDLTLSLDQVLGRDEPYYLAAGAEYVAWRMLALRVGYRTGQEIGLGLRAGFGFKLKILEVDYAFGDFGDLGQAHRVDFSVRLGGPVENTLPEERAVKAVLKKAGRLMREGRYYEAILEYDRVLERDRGNKAALEGMKQANEKLQR